MLRCAEDLSATGLLGDIYHGRIDMACGRFRMTGERLKFLTFAYPINFSVRQPSRHPRFRRTCRTRLNQPIELQLSSRLATRLN
ncbi:hypothetical protein ANCDUO_22963 [Ancylostoma duodenale]|uniref:Uncharacterized protein n=1 Tax=Ancylostoma duodenale TaxID=51022 RepID=A0A0C2FQ03_9BILA|nr:hypothetical protein ANCDUO_22963 [Ancylostoma duodenale]